MFSEIIQSIDFKSLGLFVGFGMLAVLWTMVYLRCRKEIRKKKVNFHMPGYTLIYTDQKTEEKQEGVSYGAILYSVKHDIQGKPDFIFKGKNGSLVPVEIKSGNIGENTYPHEGDLLQLAAYFIIVQEVYGVRPKFGKLMYRDAMFIVRNTTRLKKQVLLTLARMRAMLKSGEGCANGSFAICRYCVCNGTVCKYSGNETLV